MGTPRKTPAKTTTAAKPAAEAKDPEPTFLVHPDALDAGEPTEPARDEFGRQILPGTVR